MKRIQFTAILILVALVGCIQPPPAPATLPSTTVPQATPSATPPAKTFPPSTPTPSLAPGLQVAFEETEDCPFNIPSGAEDAVQCGFVIVPEDHDNPAGAVIRLAVVVVKDRSTGHQSDPVILLSGGPGEKTVAKAPAYAVLVASLHPNRDLILFDQRGVGLSEPALECPEFLDTLFDLLDEPDINAAIPAQYESIMACRDRLISQGHDLSHYTTRQNAADVNAIRIALGYEQINLLGGSYGSLLAQAVMRDFPENIRSVVLNSVLPLEKSLLTDGSLTIAKAILHLLDSCEADPACSAAYPDLQNKLYEVVDQLNEDPVPIMVTNPIDGQTYEAYLTGDGVVGNLGTFLYVSQIIPVLPQAISDVYNGDYQLMTQLSSTKLSMLDLTSRGMMLSVLCSDDLIGLTAEDWLKKRSSLPRQLTGGADPQIALEYGSFAICKNWPVEQGEPWVKEPLISDIPTLLLEGEFDPVTPPEYGRLVDGYLSRSYFYEIPGAGHDVLANTCALSIASGFIQDPDREPQAVCVAEIPDVAFDIPGQGPTELVLEPFSDPQRGFSGLVPSGWRELAPANLLREKTALDPTDFVLEAVPGTAEQLFGNLAAQLGLEPAMEPVGSAEVGNFSWKFYSFSRGANQADLALAEDGGKAYFVFMNATPDEHDALYQELFMPAVEAMNSLD